MSNPYGNKIHGQKGTGAYTSWQNMKARAKTRPDHPGYDKRWEAFWPFFEEMGPRPLGTELGRRDHSKPYCMENCFWQDATENRSESNTRRWVRVRCEICEWRGKRIKARSAPCPACGSRVEFA